MIARRSRYGRLLGSTALVAAMLALATTEGGIRGGQRAHAEPMSLLTDAALAGQVRPADPVMTEPLRPHAMRAARPPAPPAPDHALTEADRALAGSPLTIASVEGTEYQRSMPEPPRKKRKSGPAFQADFSIKPSFNTPRGAAGGGGRSAPGSRSGDTDRAPLADTGAAPAARAPTGEAPAANATPAGSTSPIAATAAPETGTAPTPSRGEARRRTRATPPVPTAAPRRARTASPAHADAPAATTTHPENATQGAHAATPPAAASERTAATPEAASPGAIEAAPLPDNVPRRHPTRTAILLPRPEPAADTPPSEPAPPDAPHAAPPAAEAAPAPTVVAVEPAAEPDAPTAPHAAPGSPETNGASESPAADHPAPAPARADEAAARPGHDAEARTAPDAHDAAPSHGGAAADGHAAPAASGHAQAKPDSHGNPHARDGEAETPAPPPVPPLPADYDGPRPDHLIRLLTTLQDDIARGSVEALKAQRILARRLGETFQEVPPGIWAIRSHANALAIYALSGGNPTVVRTVSAHGNLAPPYDAVVAGALAFMEGRAKDAKRHFEPVRVASLDHSVRGSVLLALAALSVADDPNGARILLDRARVESPATLVEEAALRRTVLIAAERDDLSVFDRMVGRYLRKFAASVYAGNFRQRLASALTRMSFIDEPAAFVRLESMLSSMTVASRQELYLLLARAAIENGNRLAAEMAARRAGETATPGSLDHRRARLYEAAAEIVDPNDYVGAVATLNALREEALPDDDRVLLEAALRLSSTVSDLPVAAPARTPVLETDPAPEPGDPAGPPTPLDAAPAPAAADTPIAAADTPNEAEAGPFARVSAMEQRVANAIAAIDTLLEDTQ
ncbi:hypothetical protein [Acuticoccus kandeliae]|uniref:hypothetical protein n=1 Tax=Acuticoccus kandeliae TaxID=2073160 RepID=UPI000D3E30F5|nr:hypothetical protein [Acuticoccus kandeliae]